VAFGMTAPSWSVTVPEAVALESWPEAETDNTRKIATARIAFNPAFANVCRRAGLKNRLIRFCAIVASPQKTYSCYFESCPGPDLLLFAFKAASELSLMISFWQLPAALVRCFIEPSVLYAAPFRIDK
jgi:hypothetical protein